MKLFEKFKKITTSILPILVVFLSGIIIVQGICFQENLNELGSQIEYMIETTNIMQAEMSGMESSVKSALAEESNPVETYVIEVVDTNPVENTYDVKISVILKETSESTKCSIFFGTTEIPLTLNRYIYEGECALSLDENYDGNVTILVDTGEKRTTKVLDDYVSPFVILLPQEEE